MLLFYLSVVDTADDKTLLERLYLDYRVLMKRIAYKILGDDALAEDAVHNAFLRIISNLEKFYDKSCQETEGLIVIIIRSASIDMYRKRRRELENSDISDISDIQVPANTDFSVVEAKDILKSVEALPENYRNALLLKVEYAFTDREIGAMLGISTSAASKRLERARKLMQTWLYDEVM